MSEAQTGTAAAKLPLLATIKRSYQDYFAHFGDVVAITWPWAVASALAMGLAVLFQFAWMARAVADIKQSVPIGPTPAPVPQMPLSPPETIVLAVLANVALALAIPSIAVAWHRLLLLNERPGFAARNVLGRDFWRYVGGCLLIGIIVGLPLMLVIVPVGYLLSPLWTSMGPSKLPSQQVWAPLIMSVAGIAALAALMHLIVLLPARAIGNTGVTMGEAWLRTRGNAWRLFAGLVVTVAPLVLLGQALAVAITGQTGADLFKMSPSEIKALGTQYAIASALSLALYLLVVPVGIGFLSHAYRHFFPASDPSPDLSLLQKARTP